MTDRVSLNGLQQAILGTMMTWNNEIDTAAGILAVEDFTQPIYRDVFSYLVDSKTGDYILIAKHFNGKYPMHEIMRWTEDIYVPTHIKQHCMELKEESTKFALYRSLVEMQKSFEGKTSTEIIEGIERQISAFGRKHKNEPSNIKEMLKTAIDRHEYRYLNRGRLTGIPYGWDEVDKATNGLHRGDLVVVAGRPSMGKSAFASNIAENICTDGYSALIFSLEMSKDQLIDRMHASIGQINFSAIRSGNFSEADFGKLHKPQSVMFKWRLSIDDSSAITIHEIRAKARNHKRQLGLDILIVDYLQLMGISSRDNRVQAIGEISRGLKQLARELDIAVIALSQLNRAVDGRPDKRPVMSDLRDSGEIEQDADVIIFPFRPAAYCDKCRDNITELDHDPKRHQAEAEIIIEKQRNGERNLKIPLAWIGKHQKFVSLEQ